MPEKCHGGLVVDVIIVVARPSHRVRRCAMTRVEGRDLGIPRIQGEASAEKGGKRALARPVALDVPLPHTLAEVFACAILIATDVGDCVENRLETRVRDRQLNRRPPSWGAVKRGVHRNHALMVFGFHESLQQNSNRARMGARL